MAQFGPGRYRARFAENAADVLRCQQLRYLAFVSGRGLRRADGGPEIDGDGFDEVCRHVMIEEARTGQLVCCFRMLLLGGGAEIGRSYSAQFYGLGRLARYPGRMAEMGRFCIHPARRDPAIARLAWSTISRFVEAEGVELIFGCSSFHGVDADAYRDAFALLKEKHLAPPRWLPRVKAPTVFCFARLLRLVRPDLRLALRRMPPLLRSYLAMGGWVSDHAVIDPNLRTLHVFTGLETRRVPQVRAGTLRRARA